MICRGSKIVRAVCCRRTAECIPLRVIHSPILRAPSAVASVRFKRGASAWSSLVFGALDFSKIGLSTGWVVVGVGGGRPSNNIWGLRYLFPELVLATGPGNRS